MEDRSPIAAYCLSMFDNGESSGSSPEVTSSGEAPKAFSASGLLSLLIDATDGSAKPELVEETLKYFPYLVRIFSKIPSAAKPLSANFKAELVSRCFITILSHGSRKSGEEENHVGQWVTRFMPSDMIRLKAELAGAADVQLLCFLFFRFAKLFMKLGALRFASEACLCVMKVIGDRSDMEHLRLATIILMIRNFGVNEETREMLNYVFRSWTDVRHSISPLLLTGFMRETLGLRKLDLPMLDFETVKESLTEALKRKEIYNETVERATIHLTLAEHVQSKKEFPCSAEARLNPLKRAIAVFRQAECRCGFDFMRADYYYELLGATHCPRHQLLADALLLQGNIQRQHGFIEEAKASFKEGSDLVVRHSTNDKGRQFSFCFYLIMLEFEACEPLLKGAPAAMIQVGPSDEQYPQIMKEYLMASQEDTRNLHLKTEEGVQAPVTSQPIEICEGFTTVALLAHLLNAAQKSRYPIDLVVARKIFPEISDILATHSLAESWMAGVELATRCLIKIICHPSRTSGKDENIAMSMVQVVFDMEAMHAKLDSGLLCFLIFRCAKILWRLGRKEEARRACDTARPFCVPLELEFFDHFLINMTIGFMFLEGRTCGPFVEEIDFKKLYPNG